MPGQFLLSHKRNRLLRFHSSLTQEEVIAHITLTEGDVLQVAQYVAKQTVLNTG